MFEPEGGFSFSEPAEEQITVHDWAEDFADDNGNYWNHCCYCHEDFLGHKRRVVCSVCHYGRQRGVQRSRILRALVWLGIIAVLSLGFCAVAVVGSR